jgi:hypothetical protein
VASLNASANAARNSNERLSYEIVPKLAAAAGRMSDVIQ